MLREPDATLEGAGQPVARVARAEQPPGLSPAQASRPDEEIALGSIRARPTVRRISLMTTLAVPVVVGVILLAVFADKVAPYDPLEGNYGVVRQAPTAQHWFGTDDV